MFTFAADTAMNVVVWLFSGPENSDSDFEAYVQSLLLFCPRSHAFARSVGVLVVDPGNPPPDARWRRRIADASHAASDALFVLVSDSVVIRGVVTAINWIRPPAYAVRVCGTFPAAIAAVEAWRGVPMPMLPKLLAEARQDPWGPPSVGRSVPPPSAPRSSNTMTPPPSSVPRSRR